MTDIDSVAPYYPEVGRSLIYTRNDQGLVLHYEELNTLPMAARLLAYDEHARDLEDRTEKLLTITGELEQSSFLGELAVSKLTLITGLDDSYELQARLSPGQRIDGDFRHQAVHFMLTRAGIETKVVLSVIGVNTPRTMLRTKAESKRLTPHNQKAPQPYSAFFERIRDYNQALQIVEKVILPSDNS